MRIFAFFMLDCLVWFDLGSIPFWSQDRSRIVQNQSKSVQNRSTIGSKSVQNRFKIGPKSILERSWGVLGRPGAAWGYLVRFLIEKRKTLDPPGPPSWVPKSTQIDQKSMSRCKQNLYKFSDRCWSELGPILAPKWEEMWRRIRRFLIIVLDVDPERLRKPFVC